MAGKRFGSAAAVCLVAAIIGGACSSGGSSNGDKAAFCKTNAEVNAALSTATSADDFLASLKTQQSKFDAYVKNAPSEVKADAQLQVDAAKKGIASGDVTPFNTDTKLQAAGTHVDSFCGQSSSSSTSSSSSSSSQSAASSSGGSKNLVACNVFNLNSLNSATGLTWKVIDASSQAACVIQADNGNTVSMALVPTSGQNSAALVGAKSACDAGTVTEDSTVADGAITCKVSGVNSASALYTRDNILITVAAVTFNSASDTDIQNALTALLKSFEA